MLSGKAIQSKSCKRSLSIPKINSLAVAILQWFDVENQFAGHHNKRNEFFSKFFFVILQCDVSAQCRSIR